MAGNILGVAVHFIPALPLDTSNALARWRVQLLFSPPDDIVASAYNAQTIYKTADVMYERDLELPPAHFFSTVCACCVCPSSSPFCYRSCSC
jgi:hypothetical protein